MRVIAGCRKGLRLICDDVGVIRPTTDSVKEVIFDVLGPLIQGYDVLDIFAGTGSLGIEALSRGAAKAVFVENNQRARQNLIKNLHKAQFQKSSVIIKSPARQALRFFAKEGMKFDLILADPPYDSDLARAVFEDIQQENLLTKAGLFVLEQSSRSEFLAPETQLIRVHRKKKGDTVVSFY